MAYTVNDNTITLFKNDKPNGPDSPPYSGQGKFRGVEFWVAAWVNETKEGKKYFSIKLREKEAREPKPIQPPAQGYKEGWSNEARTALTLNPPTGHSDPW